MNESSLGPAHVDTCWVTLKSEKDLSHYLLMDLIFCVITGILFSVGLFGNLWVIQRIILALKHYRSSPSPRHVLVYIGALTIIDLSLLLNCPFVINDVASMQWNFGVFLCKWVYGNESMNKLLTGFILAVLSLDQLITVRKIAPPKWRTVTAAWKVIVSMIFFATIVLTPLFLYTRVEILLDEKRDPDHNSTVRAIHKCVFAPPADMTMMASGFMTALFIVGFCVPTICITVSYGSILHRFAASGYARERTNQIRGSTVTERTNQIRGNTVTERTNQRRESTISGRTNQRRGSTVVIERTNQRRSLVNRRLVTSYLLLLVVIYFCCWTPYWITTMSIIFYPQYYHELKGQDHLTSTYTLLYIHLLPYLNAVLNAFAYGCMITVSKSKKERRKREEKDEQGLLMTCRNTRLSIGETWSIGSISEERKKKTVTRKWPSSIEVHIEKATRDGKPRRGSTGATGRGI